MEKKSGFVDSGFVKTCYEFFKGLPIWRNGWISELSKPVDWFHFQSNVCLSQCYYHSTVNLFLRSISLKAVLRIQFQKIFACDYRCDGIKCLFIPMQLQFHCKFHVLKKYTQIKSVLLGYKNLFWLINNSSNFWPLLISIFYIPRSCLHLIIHKWGQHSWFFTFENYFLIPPP